MPTSFMSGTDWECSSGPIITRDFSAADLWPVGLHGDDVGGAKDYLEDGLHPVVAIGPQHASNGTKYNRPRNLTGVVISYNADADIAQVNVADKVCVVNYVANITSYSGGSPVFTATMSIGAPVYVDDSPDLGLGVTLSLSPLNDANGPNPLAGYLFYCQDEYVNYGIGGPNVAAVWPKTVSGIALVENAYCILLVNDYGDTNYDYHIRPQ